MKANNLNDVVIELLLEAGWFEGRDKSAELVLDSKKYVSKEFHEVANNLAYLKLSFEGFSGNEILYFDLDESKVSGDMRAQYFGFASADDINWKSDLDYKEKEDFDLTNKVSDSVGVRLSRIGFLDEEFGVDLFIDEEGAIYWAHWDEATRKAESIEEFLNLIIVRKL